MADSAPDPAPGPIDRLLGGYLLLTAVALAFPHRPEGWPALLALHVVLGVLLLAGAPARLRSAARGRALRALVDWYPLLLMPFLYWELPHLGGAIWDQHYFDATVQAWEQGLFGQQPSMALARLWDLLPLSELLHAAYLAYYPVIYALPAVLYAQGRLEPFLETIFAIMLGFTASYVVFIVFPVQGPRYLFPAPGGTIAEGTLYRLTHTILETGSSRGAAFPSSHAAIAAIQTVSAYRHLPRGTPLFAAITVGIGFGAVYGGFHYAVDMIAGTALGLLVAWAAPAARGWLGAWRPEA